MNRGTFIRVWVGFLGTFLTAWIGLVILPVLNLGRLDALDVPEPPLIEGGDEGESLVNLGRTVYVSKGCVYCHSQQVRPESAGSDIRMGWGQRRTYPQDYLNDKVALLGTMRTGPDLSNIGLRQPSETWHLAHLYNPQITSPGSIMPPYAFLFEERKIDGAPAPDALQLSGEFAPPPGYEVVPTPEARALVAYLLSLRKSEAPAPEKPLDDG